MLKDLSRKIFVEDGRTLVEILISITILAIVTVPIASMFVQSARSINVAEELMDATYVAQTVMEEIYHISDGSLASFDALHEAEGFDYSPIDLEEPDYIFQQIKNGYEIEVILSNENDLVNVLVKVIEQGKLSAQMETYLDWK
ncbi:type IV pilus modification PilV family protein [Evansella cellulosilytica]|uniref:Prepilin-type N-terminal cleavage/methylation domain-containing protein n=1 Tax=Evansella cellulosilytica (strain ATCC 21833 / DSM 2522 / FERM P-1141 / JCM 9156 / N-4) TaxID=649639 RepID=E6TZP1_EVAC2|nr:hypothetical protein [Evansella cellulosilytica]ADU31347.1 hypothetical protein Bcell_3104 [Evansella cellulosilytica DSM 2522]